MITHRLYKKNFGALFIGDAAFGEIKNGGLIISEKLLYEINAPSKKIAYL